MTGDVDVLLMLAIVLVNIKNVTTKTTPSFLSLFTLPFSLFKIGTLSF
jgi:hypothetical protein